MAKKSSAAAPQLYPALARALRDLHPTRDGFEGLLAALIEATTGGQLALMSSGDQVGVDGVAPFSGFAPRRAMQAKRYAQSTTLDQNHLLGEMDRAGQRFVGLDCWVLGSTKTIRGKEREELQVHAEGKGWGLVVLDWSLFGGLPRLATLCAGYREISDHFITSAAARAELTLIASTDAFVGALSQLQRDLAGAEVGFEPAREAAASQMDVIFSDRFAARRLAGASPTYLSQAPPVARANVEKAIANWWTSGQTALALLGNEGAGKTWAALSALRVLGAEAGGPLTVVIPSAAAERAVDGLVAVVEALTEIADGAGWSAQNPADFWRRRLRLWAQCRTDGPQPRLLVFVDGLDELDPFNWDSWFSPLLEAKMAGLIRIIVGCRRDDWQQWAKLRDLDSHQLEEFTVPLFQTAERDAFFESQGVDVNQVSTQVLEAALHPRTAFHVTRLGAEIGDFKRITRELILLRDFQNRYELKRGLVDPEAFKSIVIRMAREAETAVLAKKAFSASAGDVIGHAVEITGHEAKTMRRVLSELVSGGWVQRAPGSPHDLTFTDKALPLAVGMALASEIQSRPLVEARAEVDRLLQPWEADDLIEPVLRTCATVLITQGASDDLCREVLQRWAGVHFHSHAAQDFWRRLHVFRPELFLDLLETGATGSGWLGEWGVASLWEDQPECVCLVEVCLQKWLTRIGLPRHRARSDAKFEAYTNRERFRQLRRLKALERCGEVGWLDLLGTEIEPKVAPFYRAVRTIGFLPRASFVPGIAAWAVAAAVSGRPYGAREIAALLRDNPFDWKATVDAVAKAALAMIALNTGIGRSAAALLLEATGRPEDAIRATELRPRLADEVPKLVFIVENDELAFGPDASRSDRALVASLVDFAANPDLPLSGPLRAEFDRIVLSLNAADIGSWLDGERPLIAPLLRWARGEALAKIRAFIDAGPLLDASTTPRFDFATATQRVFPVLSASQRSQCADRIEAQGTERGIAVVTALRLLPLSFSNQIALLTSLNPASWPQRVDTLLREHSVEEYLEQIDNLDFAGHAGSLKTKLHLLSKSNERHRPGYEAKKVDWAQAFTHADIDIRALSLDLADTIGGPRAARQLAATGWSSVGLPPVPAYEGSSVLGALPDSELEPLGSRLNGEYCLRLLHQRPGLRATAEAGIWRWIAGSLETPRTSHSIGGTWCHYSKRDEAFAEFVAHNGDQVHQVLAKVWADHRLKNNLLFGDWDGPGWPLLKALATQQPNFVKQIWREAVTHGRGFSSSFTSGFPADLPPGPDFDDVRLEMLGAVHTDDSLFGYARALQRNGHLSFVKDLIAERFNRDRPYDRAWAMTLAGFLIPTDEAEAIWREHLSRSPVGGWLVQVYEASRRSFDSALHMRHWCLKLVEDDGEADAWCAFRLAQLDADDRYVDLMEGPPFLFENKDNRVGWLNFLSSEGQDARKKARQALANTWLRGPRYHDTINGR
ncbi:hypothetical protein [Mesorhizobium sp. M0013]|uniref:hypothetical protein n=1 Tax=Mesorhizobium sp. M0013 TaxID=2956841 RepID=UPI0033364E88